MSRAQPNPTTEPNHADTARAVYDFLRRTGWVPDLPAPSDAHATPGAVRFLAAGEYNENYLVTAPSGRTVLRINHGTQLGLADQIGYEFRLLRLLEHSSVTPKAHFVDPEPGDPLLGKGVLLMDYLPGEPLDYARDTATAARIFAHVHAQPVPNAPESAGLVVQADPVGDIAAESDGLLHRFPDHALQTERDRLLRLRDEVLQLRDDTRELFADEPMVLVNTEVNSHNFLIPRDGEPGNDAGGWLIDWEKGVVSTRFQDLAHFTVATTTRWKRGYTYTDEEKRAFLAAYAQAGGLPHMDMDDAWRRLMVLERTILLRALSWCHMAYHEYTRPGRPLSNPDTFEKIREYLDGMECLLA